MLPNQVESEIKDKDKEDEVHLEERLVYPGTGHLNRTAMDKDKKIVAKKKDNCALTTEEVD